MPESIVVVPAARAAILVIMFDENQRYTQALQHLATNVITKLTQTEYENYVNEYVTLTRGEFLPSVAFPGHVGIDSIVGYTKHHVMRPFWHAIGRSQGSAVVLSGSPSPVRCYLAHTIVFAVWVAAKRGYQIDKELALAGFQDLITYLESEIPRTILMSGEPV